MLTSKRHQHFSSYISRLVDCPKKAKMSKIKDMLTTSNTGNDERMEVSQQSTPVENESTSPSSSSSATMTTRSTRRQRITINNMLQTTSTTTTTTTKSNYESDLAAMKEAIIRELAVEEQHVDVKQEAVDVLEEEMTDYYHQMQQQDDDDDEDDNGDDGEEGQGDEDVDFEPPLSPRDDCESSSRRRRYPVRNSPNRYNHRRINSNPHEESLSNEEESGVKIKPKIQIKLAISEKKERKRPGPQKKPKINEIIAIQNKQQRQNSPEPTDLEATGEDGKAKKSANYELLATARKLAKLEAVLHNNERRPGAPRRPKISEMICPNSEITQQELEQYQQQYQQHNDQEKQSKPDEQAANSNVINENPQEEVVENEPKRKKAGAPKRAKISEIVAAAEKAASLTQLSTNGTESGPIKCHLNKSSTERISDLIRSSTITSSQTTITTPVATNSQPAQLGESTAAATNKPTTNANSKMTRKIIDILTSQQQLQEQQQPFAGGRSNKVQQRENAVKSSASSESKSASDKILSKTPISQIMRAVNNNNGPLKPTATNLLEKRTLPQPPPSTTTTTKTQSTTTTTSSRKINNYLYGDDPEKRPTMNQGRLLISDILNRNNTNTNIQNTQQTGKSTISSMLTISMLNNNNTITNSTNTCITASTLSVADNNTTTSEPTKKMNVEDEGLEEGEVYVKSEPVVIERDENLERAHDLMMLSGAMICARCERCFVPSIEQLQQIQQQSSAAAGSSPLGNKINKMTTNDDYDNIGLCPDCSSCSKRNPKHN